MPSDGRAKKHVKKKRVKTITLRETNIAPENQWLEDVFPFGMAYVQRLC